MGAPRLIVGISGASGAIYGHAALKALRLAGVETHLVISRSGQITIAHELKIKISELSALADAVYRFDDIGAAISSGSFPTVGMLIAPCSIRTLVTTRLLVVTPRKLGWPAGRFVPLRRH